MENAPININTKGSGDNLKTVAMIGMGVGVMILANKVISATSNSTENKNEKLTEKAIQDIKVNPSKLNSNSLIYRTAADKLYTELSNHVLVVDLYSFDNIRNAVAGFNTDELKQVIKEFGLRPAKLFNLFEAGQAGSFFEWCDAILNKEERETIRELFVFTGLDKLPQEGLKYYFQFDDGGWFDSSNKHRALAAMWKPFKTSTPKSKVYPVLGSSQWMSVLEKSGDQYISRSLKPSGYGAIGDYVAYDNSGIANDVVQQILVTVTDPRMAAWLGKTFLVNSRQMNQSPPINNPTLYPL